MLAINTGLHNPQHKLFWQSQMDKVVQKAVKLDETRSATPTSAVSSSKPCRYGDSCSRPGCRFRHSFDTVATSSSLYCSNNWLPHSISLSLNGDDLIVEKYEKNEVSGTFGIVLL